MIELVMKMAGVGMGEGTISMPQMIGQLSTDGDFDTLNAIEQQQT